MNKVFVIIIIIFSLNNPINSKVIRGKVIDNDTQLSIAFSNISINGYSYGTISNEQGGFSLKIPDRYMSGKLVISFVGYTTKEYNIADINEYLSVYLEPVATQIQEVRINPDSTIYTFLKKIYKKIPDNYPTEPTLLTGFYRETVTKPAGDFLYLAEAITGTYKTSYKNNEVGQVEIIKSRKNISSQKDSVMGAFKYYGGVYTSHYSDIVHERYDFIKPSGFSKYGYEFLGESQFNNDPVYVFEFFDKDSTKNKVTRGKFYIHVKSLAYVYFDIEYIGNWQREIGSLYYTNSTKKVLYNINHENKWVLKSVNRKSNAYFKSRNQHFVTLIDYVTIDCNDKQVKPIAYENQIQVKDIFTDVAKDYNPAYWEGYNVLQNDSITKKQIQQQIQNTDSKAFLEKDFEKEKTWTDKLIDFLPKLKFEFGLYYNHYSYEVDKVMLAFESNTLNTSISDDALNVGYFTILGYKFGKHLSINYTSFEGLNKLIYTKKNQFGIEYLVCLKPGGRQFFALPSVKYGYGYSGYGLGEIKLAEDTKFQGETFNSAVKLYSGQKKQDCVLGLKLQTSISPMFNLVLGVDYSIPIQNNHYILVRESKGLIKNKAYQPFKNDIEYYEDGVLKTQSSYNLNKWSFNLGIRVSF